MAPALPMMPAQGAPPKRRAWSYCSPGWRLSPLYHPPRRGQLAAAAKAGSKAVPSSCGYRGRARGTSLGRRLQAQMVLIAGRPLPQENNQPGQQALLILCLFSIPPLSPEASVLWAAFCPGSGLEALAFF